MIFGFNTDVKTRATPSTTCKARRARPINCCRHRFSCVAVAWVNAPSPMPTPPRKPFRRTTERTAAPRSASPGAGIDQGREVGDVLDKAESETLAAIKQLDVQWENAASIHANSNLTMQLRVTEDGAAVKRRPPHLPLRRPEAAPFYTQAITDSSGTAAISVEVEESALPDASVMVQANHEGRTVTRKFALRKAEV